MSIVQDHTKQCHNCFMTDSTVECANCFNDACNNCIFKCVDCKNCHYKETNLCYKCFKYVWIHTYLTHPYKKECIIKIHQYLYDIISRDLDLTNRALANSVFYIKQIKAIKEYNYIEIDRYTFDIILSEIDRNILRV
jgi:hypothetical protein